MGFFLMLVLVMILTWMFGSAMNYVMDSVFLASIYRRMGKKHRLTCSIPFYGQYLMGKLAGKGWMGALVAGCHIVVLLAFLSNWFYFLIDVFNKLVFLLPMALLLGFLGKECIVYDLIGKNQGKRKYLIICINVITLGFFRSIMLFAMRKRVELPTIDAQD